MIASNVGEVFGFRVNAWHVLTHLVEMMDKKQYWKYSLETVNVAIEIEVHGQVLQLWSAIEA